MGSLYQIQPIVGIGILVLDQGQILLGKRKNSHGSGTWAFPGGRLELGETIKDCAIRELDEETNLQALQTIILAWEEVFFSTSPHHNISFFVCVPSFSGQLINKEPDKTEDWQWFPTNALPTPLFDPIKKIATGQSLDSFLEKNPPVVV